MEHFESLLLFLALTAELAGVVVLALDIYAAIDSEREGERRGYLALYTASDAVRWRDQPVSPPIDFPIEMLDEKHESLALISRRKNAGNGIGLICLGFFLAVASIAWSVFPPT